jgi:hypothetical protein
MSRCRPRQSLRHSSHWPHPAPALQQLGNFSVSSNLINQFGFIHTRPLVMEINKQKIPASSTGAAAF